MAVKRRENHFTGKGGGEEEEGTQYRKREGEIERELESVGCNGGAFSGSSVHRFAIPLTIWVNVCLIMSFDLEQKENKSVFLCDNLFFIWASV